MKPFFKFLIYNIFWFATAHIANSSFEPLTLLFPIILMVLFGRGLKKYETQFLITFVLFGISFDVISQQFGLISFKSYFFNFSPVWLIGMWILFSTVTLDLFLAFKNFKIVLGILAGVFGPLSYSYGQKISLLTFNSNLSIIIYTLFWTVFLMAGQQIYFAILQKNQERSSF